MRILLIAASIALIPLTANAWNGIYRGYRARVFYNNPYASSPFIAGAGYGSSPRYYRGSRGYRGGYSRGVSWLDNRIRTDALQDIATSLQMRSPIGMGR